MGGYGSGNFGERYNKKGVTSGHRQLDSFSLTQALRLMKQKNLEIYSSTYNWPDLSKVACRLWPDRLEVTYRSNGAKRKDIFRFASVPNHYGGQERIYFLCPYCNRRSRYLYLTSSRFKCRICAKLNYESQQSGKGENLAAMKVMLYMWSRLRCIPPTSTPTDIARHVPLRPKGMHRATYERHLQELNKLQRVYIAEHSKQWQRIHRSMTKAREELLTDN